MIISSCYNLSSNLISIFYFIKLYLQMIFESVLMFTGFVSNNKSVKLDMYLHCLGENTIFLSF